MPAYMIVAVERTDHPAAAMIVNQHGAGRVGGGVEPRRNVAGDNQIGGGDFAAWAFEHLRHAAHHGAAFSGRNLAQLGPGLRGQHGEQIGDIGADKRHDENSQGGFALL